MKLETLQQQTLPTDTVFVEDFQVYYADDGLKIAFKSKQFAEFAKRISTDAKPHTLQACGYNNFPFEVPKDTLIWVPKTALVDAPGTVLSCLYPNEPTLIIPNATVGANLAFLLLDGVEKGIEVGIATPVPVSTSIDYYYAALQGFQGIYTEWLRPFTLKATMKEKKEMS